MAHNGNVPKLKANFKIVIKQYSINMKDVWREVNRDFMLRRAGYVEYKKKCLNNIQVLYAKHPSYKKMVNINNEVIHQKACFFVADLQHPVPKN